MFVWVTLPKPPRKLNMASAFSLRAPCWQNAWRSVRPNRLPFRLARVLWLYNKALTFVHAHVFMQRSLNSLDNFSSWKSCQNLVLATMSSLHIQQILSHSAPRFTTLTAQAAVLLQQGSYARVVERVEEAAQLCR